MEEEKIQAILKDPNTWCWDGVTLPEDGPDMSHVDEVTRANYQKALEIRVKKTKIHYGNKL